MIIWDYDSALGQINSSFPYNFKYDPIYQEIENVEYILRKAAELEIKMTFACLGFAAEKGIPPFNIPDQIKKISDSGHEIASHSWKHEWFPYLTDKQIYKSLERSKYSLEECTDKKGSAVAFGKHSQPFFKRTFERRRLEHYLQRAAFLIGITQHRVTAVFQHQLYC